MSVFWRDAKLESGAWAHGLSWLLAPKRLVNGWHPKIRVEHPSGRRYVQFEPANWSGPFVFAGRPAVKAMSDQALEDEALVVGYLVERGYRLAPSHLVPDHEVVDRKWHWKGFERVVTEHRLGNHVNDLMNGLAPSRRIAWTVIAGPETPASVDVPYIGTSTLESVKTIVDAAGPDQWASVMLGAKFPKEECLRFTQTEILNEFSAVILQAAEIAAVVEKAIP